MSRVTLIAVIVMEILNRPLSKLSSVRELGFPHFLTFIEANVKIVLF